MSLFLITLRALAPLFLLILLGYGLKRARLLHAAHVPVLNGLVVNVTLPALIVRGLATTPRLPHGAMQLPLALLGAQAVTMALAWLLGRAGRFSSPVRGALLVVGVFGNTAFLGYPMTLALHPDQFPAGILLDQFGMTVVLYLGAPLIGAHFGTAGGAGRDARATTLRFLRSPVFLGLAAGAAARLIPWPPAWLGALWVRDVGQVVGQCLTYLGQGTTPVVLLALGAALRPGAGRRFVRPLLLAAALKLVVCPLAMWGLCRALGLHGGLLAEGLLMAAMPTAVMASVLSAEHDLEGDFAVSVAFSSTVLSALSVPLALSVLR
ncbi:MAG: AEC family transporter [Armatimonadetes bacterium]|nr:AEC family transporter [Armatimonadota bacterium]